MSYITKILNENKIFAVVGVSASKEKYGYEVFKALVDHKYKTFPVNPKYESIDGYRCYKSLVELPEKPEVVVTVVPPAVTEQVIDTCIRSGISKIWMPPGSWSETAVKKCEENSIQSIHDVCLVFALKSLNKKGGSK
ncbi:MAG: CoA-binding protein [Candidatus Aminicenantaceae bacterium]